MSLLEVVIAAAILFIIMTGVLGLIGRTLSMGAQAKEINVSNNAVNSYVEWVRSLPFDSITTTSTPPSIETTVVVADEYTITIVPQIAPGSNDALKEMTLTVTVNRADGFTETFSTMVVVRDRDQNLTEATRNPSTDPRIKYVSPSPPDGTVVWYEGGQSWWKDATGTLQPLQFKVEVKPSSGRTIQIVRLEGENSWVLMDVFNNQASWSQPTWTVSPLFAWDLAQMASLTEPQVKEGRRDVWALTTDNASAQGSDMRVYLVDNLAPSNLPAAPTFTPSTTSWGGKLDWAVVNDGNTFADHYYLRVLRHDVYGTWTSPGWPAVFNGAVPSNTWTVPSSEQPFCRYVAEAAAESPRGLRSATTAWTTFITRPKVTGTYTLSGNNKKWDVTTVSLSCGAPRFPTTGTITYQWYTVDGTTETLFATVTQSSPSPPPGPAVTASRTKDSVADYPTTPLLGYRCKVTFTPCGMYAPTTMTLTSNTVYAEMPAGTSKAFTEGAW